MRQDNEFLKLIPAELHHALEVMPSTQKGETALLYLLLDDEGRVLGHMGQNVTYKKEILDELFKAGTISHFFEWAPASLPQGPEKSLVLECKRNFRIYQQALRFYTSLPLFYLKTFRFAASRYLGYLYFKGNLLPNLYSSDANCVIYINRETDTLTGFSDYFFSLFKGEYRDPLEMLDRPVEQFFSPSPKNYLRQIEKRTSPVFSERSEQFAHSFDRGALPDGARIAGEGVFHAGSDALEWRNPGSLHTFIHLPGIHDLSQSDMALELEITSQEGSLPILMMGNPPDEDYLYADYTGYMLGPSFAPGSFLVKKSGHVFDDARIDALPSGRVAIRYVKHGRTFSCFLNGRELIASTDEKLLPLDRSRLVLALRPGGSCLLHRLALHVQGALVEESRIRYVIRLRDAARTSCTADRFFNLGFPVTSVFSPVMVYLLTDVAVLQERIETLDRKVVQSERKARELRGLLTSYQERGGRFDTVSPAMQRLREQAETVARSDATVLIEGETGTGKEVMARFIHAQSPRRDGPFIKVDCSTIPEGLMESHLFGHEKGAFTGAVHPFTGMLELADQGTLFLDEVANIPLSVQAKLLQFFNDYTITRLGGAKPRTLSVRCILASNRNLREMAGRGLFRQDLYYRIGVIVFRMLPLRERSEDIPILAQRLLEEAASRVPRKVFKGFDPAALKKLSEFGWEGNIRELKNVVERAAVLCATGIITSDLIVPPEGGGAPPKQTGAKERRLIFFQKTPEAKVREMLEQYNGRIAPVVRAFGISRTSLYHYLRTRNISLAGFRKGAA